MLLIAIKGQFILFKVVIHPNAKVPATHYYDSFDENLSGLKGTLKLRVDEEIL